MQQQRGTPVNAATAVSGGTLPLVPSPPSFRSGFRLQFTWYGPHARPRVSEPKRIKVSATIQIEGELTADELRSIFLPLERIGGKVGIKADGAAAKPLDLPWEEAPEADAAKIQRAERIRHMAEAYREKLGEPADPMQLTGSLGTWITEFGEDTLREAYAATAAAGLRSKAQRYEWLRAWLRHRRSERRRGSDEA